MAPHDDRALEPTPQADGPPVARTEDAQAADRAENEGYPLGRPGESLRYRRLEFP